MVPATSIRMSMIPQQADSASSARHSGLGTERHRVAAPVSCPACESGRCSLHGERDCFACGYPIAWNAAKVGQRGGFWWHTSCFNGSRV